MTTMISAVPKDHIANVWNVVGPWLDKAIVRTHGRFHSVDVLTQLIDGSASLCIALRDGEIIGSLVFVITIYPAGIKVGRIDYIAGKDRDDWFHEMWDQIKVYAKANHCTYIEMVARPGTAAYVKDWGGKAIGTFMEYTLED
jgi:hypothetical protein